MKERLKREFNKWMEENEDTAGFFNPEELAQHFYNLALEDVRKESEEHYHKTPYTPLCELIQYIDQLSK